MMNATPAPSPQPAQTPGKCGACGGPIPPVETGSDSAVRDRTIDRWIRIVTAIASLIGGLLRVFGRRD